jgi:hypothetical protein
MDDKYDALLSASLAKHLAAARNRLALQMLERNLKAADGWRIIEGLRSSPCGTVFVFRPLHNKLEAGDLEVTVTVDFSGRPVSEAQA